MTNDTSFSIGVFVVFMLFIGLDLADVSIVIATYLIFSSLGQIPSGLFADRYGYKTALICGTILFLTGVSLFAFSQGFYWFLAGFALQGFGSAMRQGADQALLYEGLKRDRKEKKFKKTLGRLELITNLFWVITASAGGLLYSISERLPFYAEMVIITIALLALLTLKQPKMKRQQHSVFKQIKTSFKQGYTKPNFSKVFVFSALIGAIAQITIQYMQPLYKVLEIPEAYFGLIAAGLFTVRGLGAWYAEKVGKLFVIDKYLVLHAAIFGLFLTLILSTSKIFIVLPIVGIFYFLRGLYNPTVSTYINDKVGSENRATLLSMNSQLLTLTSSVSLFFTGFLAQTYGLYYAFYGISILSMILLIFYVISIRKVKMG